MAKIDEIAPDVYRISIYVPDIDMQFNHFLIKDEEPLLFHAGLRAFFPQLREAVARVLEPTKLRWISWSHFESDECGALNHWLELAPGAEPVCTLVGKLVSVDDFSNRPAHGMPTNTVLSTGKYRFRFCDSPHIPHGWDAGVLFEETNRTLFCSDLFHHFGDVEPLTQADLIGRTCKALQILQSGPLAGYMPYTPQTEGVLNHLADLNPRTLAVMHGSSYAGDGRTALRNLAGVLKDVFGSPPKNQA
ncbi:MAG TPA: MBL fold metallo-hydrolase [Clostridia bacterium]|nr:MBL fold metallo-hydrolase [Clostridia bacterium]